MLWWNEAVCDKYDYFEAQIHIWIYVGQYMLANINNSIFSLTFFANVNMKFFGSHVLDKYKFLAWGLRDIRTLGLGDWEERNIGGLSDWGIGGFGWANWDIGSQCHWILLLRALCMAKIGDFFFNLTGLQLELCTFWVFLWFFCFFWEQIMEGFHLLGFFYEP